MTFKRFKRWLAGLWPKRETKIVIQYRHGGLTYADWRQSQDRVRWAIEQWSTQYWQDMITVLWNEMPTPSNLADTSFECGRNVGYRECLNRIHKLREKPPRQPQHVTEEYPPADQIMSE